MSDSEGKRPERTLAQRKRDHFMFLLGGLQIYAQRIIDDVEAGKLDTDEDAAVLQLQMGMNLQEQLNLAWHCLRPGPFIEDRADRDELRNSIPKWDYDHRLVDPFEGWFDEDGEQEKKEEE
jgi:hypothetical protein